MTVAWESFRVFSVMLPCESLHCNSYGDFTVEVIQMMITWKSSSDFILTSIGDSSQSNMGIHRKVTECRSLESNNKMNKIYHILIHNSECDTCDCLKLFLWFLKSQSGHIHRVTLTIRVIPISTSAIYISFFWHLIIKFCVRKLVFYICPLIYGHQCILTKQ